MLHGLYLALLAALLVVTSPLELVLGVQVYRQPVRLVKSVLPVAAVFTVWDLYAISRHQWRYSRRQTSGVLLPGHLPVEELLFFLIVPVCSILSLEAVRRVRGWSIGDEPAGPGR